MPRAAIAILMLCLTPLVAGCLERAVSAAPRAASGEYIVALAAGVDPAQALEALAPYGVIRSESLGRNRYLVHLTRDPGPEALAALARKRSAIRYIEPNFTYRIQPPAGGVPPPDSR